MITGAAGGDVAVAAGSIRMRPRESAVVVGDELLELLSLFICLTVQRLKNDNCLVAAARPTAANFGDNPGSPKGKIVAVGLGTR